MLFRGHKVCAVLDFDAAREHAYEWVNLFNLHPQMRYKDPDLFMRGIYYLLVFLLLSGNQEAYRQYLRDFDHFLEKCPVVEQEKYKPGKDDQPSDCHLATQ